MISDISAVIMVVVILWLCIWLRQLGLEWARARTVARLVAAAEETYATEPNTPGPKFAWIMHRLKPHYPSVDYEQLGEEIKAAMWQVRNKDGCNRL